MKKLKKAILLVILVLLVIASITRNVSFAKESNGIERKAYKIELMNDTSEYGYQSFKVVDEKGNLVSKKSEDTFNVKATNFPTSYDSRTVLNSSGKSIISSVKNQGGSGSCWAFAAISSLETSLLKNNIENSPDYSESHLAWFGNRPETTDVADGTYGDGINEQYPYDRGGNYFVSGGALAKWSGAELEKYAPFDINSYGSKTYSEEERFISEAHLENMILVDSENMSDIKSAIMNYGGVTVSYFHNDNYYNYSTKSYFQSNQIYGNHAVYIVGWDDNYSKSKFNSIAQPSSNGAWLVKNSWGSYWGDSGYFWISYEDTSISDMAVFIANNNDNYNNIYQYDGYWNGTIAGWYFDNKDAKSANVFTTQKDETLEAVGVMTASSIYVSNKGKRYTIDIYKNVSKADPESGIKVSTQTGTLGIDGFETIKLKNPISLEKGTRFSIVLTVESNSDDSPYFYTEYSSECTSRKNESYYYDYGMQSWVDCYTSGDNNVYIKAYTTTNTVDKTELMQLVEKVSSVAPQEAIEEIAIAQNVLNDSNASDSDVQNAIKRLKVYTKLPTVRYTTHVQRFGWQEYVENGELSGTSHLGLRMEAIKIELDTSYANSSIEYSTHIQSIGWQDFVSDGELSGTSGLGKRLEAIKIRLKGDIAEDYDVYYRVHAQTYGWLGWAKNGEIAGTAGQAKRLEAIEIMLVKKGDTPQASDKKAYMHYNVGYRSHVQNIGWQPFVYDGALSGTSGQAKRLEAIEIKLKNQEYDGDIEYRTHIQRIGWEDTWKKNGEMSGTSGQGLRLEAIEIKLTDEMEEKYDIYYRVHAQNFGWLGWAKNGESAGTAGYGYRLEAIEIIMVDKGDTAPEGTGESFRQK